MTSTNLVSGYSAALLAIASAEGEVESTKAQLSSVAEAVSQNEELRSALSDRLLPPATRNQIVDDLLAGKTSDVTKAMVGMIVGAGHGYQLVEIVRSFMDKAASGQGNKLATVRSAVPLTEDQISRLSKALQTSVGSEVEVRNVVDPEVVGGVVTVIGDKVIDGSLRNKLDQMREAL